MNKAKGSLRLSLFNRFCSVVPLLPFPSSTTVCVHSTVLPLPQLCICSLVFIWELKACLFFLPILSDSFYRVIYLIQPGLHCVTCQTISCTMDHRFKLQLLPSIVDLYRKRCIPYKMYYCRFEMWFGFLKSWHGSPRLTPCYSLFTQGFCQKLTNVSSAQFHSLQCG